MRYKCIIPSLLLFEKWKRLSFFEIIENCHFIQNSMCLYGNIHILHFLFIPDFIKKVLLPPLSGPKTSFRDIKNRLIRQYYENLIVNFSAKHTQISFRNRPLHFFHRRKSENSIDFLTNIKKNEYLRIWWLNVLVCIARTVSWKFSYTFLQYFLTAGNYSWTVKQSNLAF